MYDVRSSFGCPDSVRWSRIHSDMAVVHGDGEAMDVVSGRGSDRSAAGDPDYRGKKQW